MTAISITTIILYEAPVGIIRYTYTCASHTYTYVHILPTNLPYLDSYVCAYKSITLIFSSYSQS